MTVALLFKVGRGSDLLDSWPLADIIGKQAGDKILEALASCCAIHGLKVGIVLLAPDHIVVFVAKDLGPMRELALHDHKQKHAEREEVHLGPIIDSVGQNLGSHIAWRTHSALHFLNIAGVTEAQIDDLEDQIAVDKDVFELEIPVDDSYFSVHVIESIQHLIEKQSACILAEATATRKFNQVKHVDVVAA